MGLACLAAPYHYTFEAEFMAEASHAGVAPREGHQRHRAASVAIADMRERGLLRWGLLRVEYRDDTGRLGHNVVAPSCLLTGECRAIEKEDVDRVHDA